MQPRKIKSARFAGLLAATKEASTTLAKPMPTRPMIEKINLPAFVALTRNGRQYRAKIVGYTEGDQKVRTVKAGVMPAAWPALTFGKEGPKNPSKPPPKHARGFAERYLGPVR